MHMCTGPGRGCAFAHSQSVPNGGSPGSGTLAKKQKTDKTVRIAGSQIIRTTTKTNECPILSLTIREGIPTRKEKEKKSF
jgi:hypothetical protein